MGGIGIQEASRGSFLYIGIAWFYLLGVEKEKGWDLGIILAVGVWGAAGSALELVREVHVGAMAIPIVWHLVPLGCFGLMLGFAIYWKPEAGFQKIAKWLLTGIVVLISLAIPPFLLAGWI